MADRKAPIKSATLYKVGTKKTGNDGNMWIVEKNKNKVNRWVLYKKSSKKISLSKSKPTYSYKTSYPSGIFNSDDYWILEIIKSYKNIYDYIIHKSLEYKIDITPSNYISGTSKVSYFKPNVYNPYTNVVDMHIVGYLDENTFTWNSSQRNTHYQTFRTTIAPYIYNQDTINTLVKLFSYNQITFPEKYRNTIPYLLSYMYDPKKANIIKFVETYPSHHFTFAFMWMSLDIPNWHKMTAYINNEFNNTNYYGGDEKTNNKNKRLLKDDPYGHIAKNYEKLFKSTE